MQKKKGKGGPVAGHEVPQGCETSKLLHFLDNRITDGSEVVKTYVPAAFSRATQLHGVS
jgi:hypothetical protein